MGKRYQFTLRQWRHFKGLSQQQLADHLGTSKQSVWNWENGVHAPHASQLKKLAMLYNVRVEQIVIKKGAK